MPYYVFFVAFQEKYEHLMIASKEKSGVEEMMMIKTQMQKERDKALDDKVILWWENLLTP